MTEKAVRIPISRRKSPAAQKRTKTKDEGIVATRVPISVDLDDPNIPRTRSRFCDKPFPIADAFNLTVTLDGPSVGEDVRIVKVKTHSASGTGATDVPVTAAYFDFAGCNPPPQNEEFLLITTGSDTVTFTIKLAPGGFAPGITDLLFVVQVGSRGERKYRRFGLARIKK